MTESEVVQVLRTYHEGDFPKTCHNCGYHYASLHDYILNTQRLGSATSYDLELGHIEVKTQERQLGGMAMVNCTCGSTLALSTRKMPISQMRLLLRWGADEMKRRGISQMQLIEHVRDEIRNQVLADATSPVAQRAARCEKAGPP